MFGCVCYRFANDGTVRHLNLFSLCTTALRLLDGLKRGIDLGDGLFLHPVLQTDRGASSAATEQGPAIQL
jgi:hypothetical protein